MGTVGARAPFSVLPGILDERKNEGTSRGPMGAAFLVPASSLAAASWGSCCQVPGASTSQR